MRYASQRVSGTNYDAQRNKFVDKFVEPNANAIMHTLQSKSGVYRNAEWAASLRTDRQERMQKKN